ncbi:MAG: acetyltransferase-like isoleucine patch superfamily enzyme [Flavobacteriaceae bacterium]|jgi:maltose O-acetyltransferase
MINKLVVNVLMKLRKLRYSFYSNNSNVTGRYRQYQPVVIRGKGKVTFESDVNFGVINSPMFYNTYAYIEARTEESHIHFGSNININNGFSIVSETKIVIANDVLIGFNCHIIDSDFHNLEIDKRHETDPLAAEVFIGKNVFIGNNVTILKGVTIGENSVVASGAIVTKSCPKNTVIAGVPAKVVKTLS